MAAASKIKYPKEDKEQIDFVDYCDRVNIPAISTQNGIYLGKGDKENANSRFAHIAKIKKMGLRKGFPDLIILARNSRHEVLFLEMKRQSGGVLSEDQKYWVELLHSLGLCVGVAKGCESAIRILNKYLAM